MAKRDPKEAGKTYLERLLQHVPEADRKLVAEKLSPVEPLVLDLGNGVLRQDEFSRAMDEGRATIEEEKRTLEQLKAETAARVLTNQKWYTDNLEAVRLVAEARRTGIWDKVVEAMQNGGKVTDDDDDAGGKPGRKDSALDLTGYVRADQLPQLIQQASAPLIQNLSSYVAVLPTLAISHHTEFGEILDTQALNRFCTDNRLDLTTGYEQFVRSRRAERAEAVQAQAIKDAEARGFEKARREFSRELPYSVSEGGEPGLIDALVQAHNGRATDDTTVAGATALYLEAVAGKQKPAGAS